MWQPALVPAPGAGMSMGGEPSSGKSRTVASAPSPRPTTRMNRSSGEKHGVASGTCCVDTSRTFLPSASATMTKYSGESPATASRRNVSWRPEFENDREVVRPVAWDELLVRPDAGGIPAGDRDVGVGVDVVWAASPRVHDDRPAVRRPAGVDVGDLVPPLGRDHLGVNETVGRYDPRRCCRVGIAHRLAVVGDQRAVGRPDGIVALNDGLADDVEVRPVSFTTYS